MQPTDHAPIEDSRPTEADRQTQPATAGDDRPSPAPKKSGRSSRLAFLKNVRIGIRIALALALPLIGLLAYAGLTLYEKKGISDRMTALDTLAALGPTLGDLTHDLQKERSMSAGFLSSEGAKFTQELPRQRQATDARIRAFEDHLAAFDTTAQGAAVEARLAEAKAALAPLAAQRQSIDRFQTTYARMTDFYAQTIATLLAILEEMAVQSTNVKVTDAIVAYMSLLQNKERAGIERALGSAGFAAHAFAPSSYRKFIQLIAIQDVFEHEFLVFATPPQRAFYKSTLQDKAVDEVARMRKIVIDSPETGHTGDIDATYWYETITRKVDLLKKVEDRLANDLRALAGKVHSDATGAFILAAAATAVLLLVTGLLVTYIVRGITGPLNAMSSVMHRLADGDTSVEIPDRNRGDEIGTMAKALQVFKDNRIEADALAAAQEKESAAKLARAQAIEARTQAFNDLVTKTLGTVGELSEGMKQSADQMLASADDVGSRATAVAAASEEASANVQTVAAAAEQLSGSIEEISRQVGQSTSVAGAAVEEAAQTNATVRTLVDSVEKIGEVMALINDIAAQTNLLALNATIEAARAGEAGKGFAVVASEVKQLANATTKATEEIESQITNIQQVTGSASTAIASIGKTIAEISEVSSAIAAAVEEQNAATREIARNVEQASNGTTDVATNIEDVTQQVGRTREAAGKVSSATSDLAQRSDELRSEITGFIADIKAA